MDFYFIEYKFFLKKIEDKGFHIITTTMARSYIISLDKSFFGNITISK